VGTVIPSPILGVLLASALPAEESSAPPLYPRSGAAFSTLEVRFPKHFHKKRIFVDPGHGTAGNEGSTTALCDKEQDVVLTIARALGRTLESSGHFEVALARTSSRGPSYEERLRAAERFGADAILSIHLDARGTAALSTCANGATALRNDAEMGFGVLLSDRGGSRIVSKRRELSRAIAKRLEEVGFPPYDGFDYEGLYLGDSVEGVFVDRRGLFMLRRPKIPSVIIETHHGLYLDETRLWREARTLEAFGDAVHAALLDVLGRS
jgi:N-acetylmuramoyl-L-alanine amidase